jgi:hypothetical protein
VYKHCPNKRLKNIFKLTVKYKKL